MGSFVCFEMGGGGKWEWVQAFLSYIFSDYFLENITMVKLFLRKLGDMIFQITLWQFIDWWVSWWLFDLVTASDSGGQNNSDCDMRELFSGMRVKMVFRVHFFQKSHEHTLYQLLYNHCVCALFLNNIFGLDMFFYI